VSQGDSKKLRGNVRGVGVRGKWGEGDITGVVMVLYGATYETGLSLGTWQCLQGECEVRFLLLSQPVLSVANVTNSAPTTVSQNYSQPQWHSVEGAPLSQATALAA